MWALCSHPTDTKDTDIEDGDNHRFQPLWTNQSALLVSGFAGRNVPIKMVSGNQLLPAWWIMGSLDLTSFKSSIQQVVDRHEVFRSSYHRIGSASFGSTVLPSPGAWVFDVSEVGTRAQALERASVEMSHQFELEKGEVLRVCVWRVREASKEEYLLIAHSPHIVCDGKTAQIFFQEACVHYITATSSAIKRAVVSVLAPVNPSPRQYADFVSWYQKRHEQGVLDGHKAFWKAYLAPPLASFSLQTDRSRPARCPKFGNMAEAISVELPAPLVLRLNALKADLQCSMHQLLLAAFMMVLRAHGKQEEVVTRYTAAGREPEWNDTPGLFAHAVFVRASIGHLQSFGDVVRSVREECLKVQKWPLPEGLLCEACNVDPSPSCGNIAQNMFGLIPWGSPTLPGTVTEPIYMPETRWILGETWLNLLRWPDGRIHGEWRMAKDLFDKSTMERMVLSFTALLFAAADRVSLDRWWAVQPSQQSGNAVLSGAAGPAADHREKVGTETVLEMHAAQVAQRPTEALFRWVDHRGRETDKYTYKSFESAVGTIANQILSSWGMQGGQTVILAYPPGLAFITAFFACLKAFVVAVPVYPPDPRQLEKTLVPLQQIAQDSAATHALTSASYYTASITAAVSRMWATSQVQWPALQWHVTDSIVPSFAGVFASASSSASCARSDTLVFLQYTSGSTGAPKGVMVTHGPLGWNVKMTAQLISLGCSDIFATWLPQYHDLGLILKFITPACCGASTVGMSPLNFMGDPELFLRTVSQYRCTRTAMPNSGFQRLVDKAAATSDLSSLRTVMVGAEPTRPATIWAFVKKFGLDPGAIASGYGLAEHVLCATGNGSLHTIVDGRITVGAPPAGIDVQIVDPELRVACAAGVEGEIWVHSPSVVQGYWRKPNETEDTFHATIKGEARERHYLRTGDLGFMRGGELFISGRIKEVIIVGGQNVYPQDLEHVVQQQGAIRRGCVASFECTTESGGAGVAIVAEVRAPEDATEELIHKIRCDVASECRVSPSAVVLVEQKSVPKTTSGKLQRRRCKELWEQGGLAVLREYQSSARVAGHSLRDAGRHSPSPIATSDEGVEHVQVQLNGISVHYVTVGDPGHPLILFLHGFPFSWRAWQEQLRHLARRGCFCVAPDMRGYHPTEAPANPAEYRLEVLVEDVRALLLHLGHGKAAIVAHDWGGIVAWAFAAKHSDMLRCLVIASAPHPSIFARHLQDEDSKQRVASEAYMLDFLSPGFSTSKSANRLCAEPGVTEHGLDGPLLYYQGNLQLSRVGRLEPCWGFATSAGNIDVPVLLLWGKDDKLTLPLCVPEHEKFVPCLEFATLEGAGHNLFQEQPSECNMRIEDFVRRQESICIVGGGIGGLALAYYLQKEGFNHITILEKECNVGGKASGVWCESLGRHVGSGQYTINDDYTAIQALADEMGVESLRGKQLDNTAVLQFDPDSRVFKPLADALPNMQQLSHGVQALLRAARDLPAVGLTSTGPNIATPISDLLRDAFVDEETSELVCKRLDNYAPAGYLDPRSEVAAAYWLKLAKYSGDGWRFVSPDGFLRLATALLEHVSRSPCTRVCRASPVDKIERQAGGVTVTSRGKAARFDRVVLTGHLDELVPIMDSTEQERQLASQLRYTDYVVTVAIVSGLPEVTYVPKYWAPGKAGRVYLASKVLEAASPPEHDPRQPVLYSLFQYGTHYETSERISDDVLRSMLCKDVLHMGGNLREIVGMKRWKFFPHVSPATMRGGFYEQVEGMQGQRCTYYAGSLMNFELTETTVEYSNTLVRRFFAPKRGQDSTLWRRFVREWYSVLEKTSCRAVVKHSFAQLQISEWATLTTPEGVAVLFNNSRVEREAVFAFRPVDARLFDASEVSIFANGPGHQRLKSQTVDMIERIAPSAGLIASETTAMYLGHWSSVRRFAWKPQLHALVTDLMCKLFSGTSCPGAASHFRSLLEGLAVALRLPEGSSDVAVLKAAADAKRALASELRCPCSGSTTDVPPLGMMAIAAIPGVHTTLCNLFAELSIRPAVRAACMEELTRVSTASQYIWRVVPYLEAVVMETLRLHPPVGNVLAIAAEELEVADVRISRGTHLNGSIYHVLRSSAFANPDEFDPERFLPPRSEHLKHPEAWLTFGIGGIRDGRKCPGGELAMTVVKAVAATVMRQCSWELKGVPTWTSALGGVTFTVDGDLHVADFSWICPLQVGHQVGSAGIPASMHSQPSGLHHGHQLAVATLCRVLSEQTGVDISPNTALLDISLTSAQLAAAQAQVLEELALPQQALPLTAFFEEGATIDQLARQLGSVIQTGNGDVAIATQPPLDHHHQSRPATLEILCRVISEQAGVAVIPDTALLDISLTSNQLAAAQAQVLEELALPQQALPLTAFFEEGATVQHLARQLDAALPIESRGADLHQASGEEVSSLRLRAHNAERRTEHAEKRLRQMQDVTRMLEHRPSSFATASTVLLQTLCLMVLPLYIAGSFWASFCLATMVLRYGESVTNDHFAYGGFVTVAVAAPLYWLASTISSGVLLVMLKWAVLGQQRPGHHQVWSLNFARLWLVRKCLLICLTWTPWRELGGTSAMVWLYRALGARVGRGAILPGILKDLPVLVLSVEDFDVISIGAGAVISGAVRCSAVSHDRQTTHRTEVGVGCVVGAGAHFAPGGIMEDGACLRPLSVTCPGARLSAKTAWLGNIAKEVSELAAPAEPPPMSFEIYKLVVVLIVSPYLWLFHAAFALAALYQLIDLIGTFGMLPLLWLPVSIAMLSAAGLSVVLKRCLLGEVRAGSYPLYGCFMKRKFFVDHVVQKHTLQLFEYAGLFGSPLCNEQLIRVFMRSLGVKLGRSGVFWILGAPTSYDLLTVDDDSFSGERSCVECFVERDGALLAKPVRIGRLAYIGAFAHVAPGSTVHGAVANRSQTREDMVVDRTQAVLGTVVITSGAMANQHNFEVPSHLWKYSVQRDAIAILTLYLMTTCACTALLSVLTCAGLVDWDIRSEAWLGPSLQGAVAIGGVLPSFGVVVLLERIAAKWIFIGRYSEGILPLGSAGWCRYMAGFLLQNATDPFLWLFFGGTAFEVWYHRLLGVRIGRNVYFDGARVMEPDLVHICSGATVGRSVIFPHDVDPAGVRLKAIRVGALSTLHEFSGLNGGTTLQDDVMLHPLAHPLIGSDLSTGTWAGAPAQLFEEGSDGHLNV
jgi:non-ribosomal peptide synthetase-like protein